MSESRTKKSIRNTFLSLLYKLLDTLLAFLLRTIFIHYLSISYLGLNSLFANILTVLSLMELGVGGSIVFALYKPLAEDDREKIVSLMGLYKKVYYTIGILVIVVGFSLTPFLKYIINLPENIDNIYLIYWLTIFNTSITYFLSYRRSLLLADQRSDINTKNMMLFRIIRFVVLSACIIGTHDYIAYLCLDIAVTFASNVHITYVVKKRYSYLNTVTYRPLKSDEKRSIAKYMYSGIISKIGQTVVNSTDNILISAFISTALVGIYANYSMITMNVQVMICLLFNSLTASIGNFAVQKNGQEAEKLFKKIYFANFLIGYISTICIYCLISPFVSIWVGGEYMLSDTTVVVISINFYIAVMQYACENFMGAVGELFYFNRYRSLVETIVNLTASILLVKYTSLGITGVFLGTTVCFLCGRIWMDARTLYKHWFKAKFFEYVKQYLFYTGLTLISALAINKLLKIYFIHFGINVFSWILAAIFTIVVTTSVLYLLFRKKDEFIYFRNLFKTFADKSKLFNLK